MMLLDPRYQPEAQRLLDQLKARGVYAPRLLLDLLTQAPEISASDILLAFDREQDRRPARNPRDTIGAAIYATRRAILARWPDPPAAGIPI
jgi:hypothetical protein